MAMMLIMMGSGNMYVGRAVLVLQVGSVFKSKAGDEEFLLVTATTTVLSSSLLHREERWRTLMRMRHERLGC